MGALQIETVEDAQKEFHLALLGNAASPTQGYYCRKPYGLNIRYRYLVPSGATCKSRDSPGEPEAILNAAVTHDPDAARAALLSQYRWTGDYPTVPLGKQ